MKVNYLDFHKIKQNLNVIKGKIEKHKFLSLFLFIVLLNLILLIFARLNWTFYYTMNDDIRMKSIIAGEVSGNPDGHVLFIRYLLSAPLSLLYKLMPSISWYNIMLEGTIFISLVVISYKVFRLNMTYKMLAFNTLAYISFFFIFALKNIIYPQFTVTAGFASVTVVVIILSRKNAQSQRAFFVDLLLIGIFTFLGVTIRSNVFYMTIVFAAVPMLINFIYKKGTNEIIITFCTILSIVGITQIVEILAYSSSEYTEYKEFNRARALVYDYLRFPEFDSNYEFYEEHNADYVVYELLDEYNIKIDNRINTDFLMDMQQYQNKQFPKDFNKLTNLPANMFNRTFTNSYTGAIACGFLLLSVSLLIKWRQKRYYTYAFYNISFIGLVISEIAFFVFTNRFPERVLVPLLMTGILSQYVIYSFVLKKQGHSPLYEANSNRINKSKILLGCSIFLFLSGMSLSSINDLETVKEASVKETAYIDYAQQYPENYYYNDASYFTGRLEVTFMENTTDIRNFMPDGGWGSGHPLLKDNMAAFDLESMEKDLLKDNVYYLSTRPVTYLENFYASKGRIVIGTVVDIIEGTDINVIKFEEKPVIYEYHDVQLFNRNFQFNDYALDTEDTIVQGAMLVLNSDEAVRFSISLESQGLVYRNLHKGKNYVFYPYRKNNIMYINLEQDTEVEVEKIVVY